MKIRRPLFIISLSILVVIYAINTMPRSTIMFSLALFALFIIIHRITKNKYTFAMALSLISALAGAMYLDSYNHKLQSDIQHLTSFESVTVTGEIVQKDSVNGTARYIIDLERVNGEKIRSFKVPVYINDILEPGMTVEMAGKFRSFTPKSNYIYSYSQGIFSNFTAQKVTVLKENDTIGGFLSKVREDLRRNAYKIFSYDTAPVAIAMGLGDKNRINDDIKDSFVYTGLSHALVVSGLHVSFIAMVLGIAMSFIPVKKKLKNIVTIIFLLLFMGIIGFQPSVIRAVVLAIAFLIGKNFILEIDNYTVLAVVILITVLSNPYTANNASLLLSYFAYFGVITAVDIASGKGYGKIVTAMLLTIFAQLFTAPVMSMLDMDVTLLSPVFNILMSIPIMAICVMAFFLPVVYCIPVLGKIVCLLLGPVCDVLIRLLVFVANFARNNFSFALVNLGSDKIKFIIFVSVIAIGMIILQFKKSNIRKILIFTVPILALLCYNYLDRDAVYVKVFDGSSNPSYIITCKNENYLVASENINRVKLRDTLEYMKIDKLDETLICCEKNPDTELYGEFSETVTVFDGGSYDNNLFSVTAKTKSRATAYIISIGGNNFAFNHNKADLSDTEIDFYFFGSDAPKEVNAKNYYYFYPDVKATREMIAKKQAVELYDTLIIKINTSSGKYTILKDVKNFGGQL